MPEKRESGWYFVRRVYHGWVCAHYHKPSDIWWLGDIRIRAEDIAEIGERIKMPDEE